MLGADQVNRALAEGLAGPLLEACGGRLEGLTWFRTDWQRGGAATAHGRWTSGQTGGQTGGQNGNQNGGSHGGTPPFGPSDAPSEGRRDSADGTAETFLRVVVKLPVNNRELLWMRRLQEVPPGDTAPPVVPRLFASGESLADYDLAWIVIEQLPYGPLGAHWHADHVQRIAEAAARFAAATAAHPVDREPRHEEWDRLLAAARDAVKVNSPPERQRWTAALKSVAPRLEALVREWESRRPIEWLHGDLHLANAMSRDHADRGAVCLLDLAEVRPGHWTEDAIYLERQLWARPERLKEHKPVKSIAEARRARGLENGDDYNRVAALRRLLLATTAPAFLKSEGSPVYLTACLERLEASLAQLGPR